MTHDRGVVVSVKGRMVVLLTPDGEFHRQSVTGPVPAIGDEVPVYRTRHFRTGIWGWTVAAALLILLIPLIPALTSWVGMDRLTGRALPLAYVTVDINPSLEMTVSWDERVVAARGLNQEGEAVLDRTRLKGLPVHEALAAVVGSAVEMGYITGEDAMVLITITSTGDEAEREVANLHLMAKLEDSARKVASGKKAAVYGLHTDMSLREEAQEKGMSPGRYAIFLEAKSAGLPVDTSSLAKGSVAQVIKAAGGNLGQVISHAKPGRTGGKPGDPAPEPSTGSGSGKPDKVPKGEKKEKATPEDKAANDRGQGILENKGSGKETKQNRDAKENQDTKLTPWPGRPGTVPNPGKPNDK